MASHASSSKDTNRPRTRQRVYKAPPPLDVPDIDEDAAERKRVLNVLAQRRYREKKRLRRMKHNSKDKQNDSADEPTVEGDESAEQLNLGGFTTDAPALDALNTLDFDAPPWEKLSEFSVPSSLSSSEALSGFAGSDNADSSHIDPELLTTSGSLTQMILATTGSPPQSFDSSSSSSLSDGSLADSYLLPVHELTLLKAIMRIASRMGCKDELWSLTARSPFNSGFGTPSDQLPMAWQPTPSQILMPHHPILDFFPWPSVRDRVIGIFSLPDETRPPNAVGPMALVHLAYDMEDSAEGVRIYGGDPYDPSCWEVGQVFFQRWWFLFDREIIENSNRWRRLRGAPPLAITNGEEQTF